MKKIPAIVFLAILLINGVGFYLYYAVQLRQIKAEMREALKLVPDSKLEILKLTRTQFKESKVDDHEVSVNGKMYDIARIKVQGDIVRIYCLHDEREDDLMALLNEFICKPLKDRDSMPQQIMQFISLTYILQVVDFAIFIGVNEIASVSPYHFAIKTFAELLDTPPPWESALSSAILIYVHS